MGYSLIILKPDALERELVDHIVKRFISDGFHIEMIGYKMVNESLIYDHYKSVIELYGDDFKEKARKAYVGKTMIPIILSYDGENAIQSARSLIGATDPSKATKGTIRGDLGSDEMDKAIIENRICENLIHGSDSFDSFREEVILWFNDDVANQYT
jgi:nucleoside-diphosphate kinase